MKIPKQVKIVEIGPRDGLQNEPTFLETDKKIALITHLVESGFQEIEATSFVHPRWIPNLADAEEVMEGIRHLPATFFALVPNEKGYERAVKSRVDGITFVLSATDSHSKKNLNRTTEESLQEMTSLFQQVQSDGLKNRASVSTVFGCPFEGNPSFDRIAHVIERLVQIGFRRIGLCDTIGVANPRQVYDWVSALLKEFNEVEFELHFHNTYGRGLTNVVAGLQAGVTSFDSSIGGLGGCPYAPGATGSISTEDLVYLLHEMEVETSIDPNNLLNVSNRLEQYLGKKLDSQIWAVERAKGKSSLKGADING